MRHKWFVFIAGLKTGCPIFRLIVHDISKFRLSEWMPYSKTFYADDGSKQYEPDIFFDYAWLSHQHRNPHHWQYWILREDSGIEKAMDMPEKYIMEMVADWAGAGRAITGKWEVKDWYQKNKHKIFMHEETQEYVKSLLERF